MGERMHRYLDEDLSATERQAYEDHLATCAACMTELKEYGVAIKKATTVEWMKT
ncbi:MAG: anti-sigma factor family protein, partial [Tumebacillaceae bacterium]